MDQSTVNSKIYESKCVKKWKVPSSFLGAGQWGKGKSKKFEHYVEKIMENG